MDLPSVLQDIIYDYNPRYELRDFFLNNKDKINFDYLSQNKNAFDLLIKNESNINYITLGLNESGDVLQYLFDNFDDILESKFNFNYANSDELFPKYPRMSFSNINNDDIKQFATNLSKNTSELASIILEKYPNLINWNELSKNPNDKAADLLIDELNNNNNKIELYDNNLITNSNNKIVDYILEKTKTNNVAPFNYDFLAKNKNPKIVVLLRKYIKNALDVYNQNLVGRIEPSNLIKNKENLNTNPDKAFTDLLNDYDFLIDYNYLSMNNSEFAIKILDKNKDKINWDYLAYNTNPDAIDMLITHFKDNKENLISLRYNNSDYAMDKLNELLDSKHIDISDFYHFKNTLSLNEYAIELLEKYPDLIDWKNIWRNKNIFLNINKKKNKLKNKLKKKSKKKSKNKTRGRSRDRNPQKNTRNIIKPKYSMPSYNRRSSYNSRPYLKNTIFSSPSNLNRTKKKNSRTKPTSYRFKRKTKRYNSI